jgi:hypothetical protein
VQLTSGSLPRTTVVSGASTTQAFTTAKNLRYATKIVRTLTQFGQRSRIISDTSLKKVFILPRNLEISGLVPGYCNKLLAGLTDHASKLSKKEKGRSVKHYVDLKTAEKFA